MRAALPGSHGRRAGSRGRVAGSRRPLAAFLLGAVLSAATAVGPAPLQGQECTDGPVSYVFIDNRSIFDLSTLGESRFSWAYRLANTLHVETRPSFIRKQLLFELGDCPDDFLLAESGRLLREFEFLARADVFAVPQPDGTRHVVVDTQDEWTTRLDVNITLDEGLQIEGASLQEENFLGTGNLVSLFFRERRERRDFGVLWEGPGVFADAVDSRLAFGATRVGGFVTQALILPFNGEVGRIAGRERFAQRKDLFAYAFGPAQEGGYVTVPIEESYGEFTGAYRFGRPLNQTQVGGGFSWERILFPGFPDATELVRDFDFENPEALPDTVLGVLSPQTTTRSATRINFLVGQRHVRYVTRTGLDALNGVQDVMEGVDLNVLLGKSVGGFQTGAGKPENDIFASFSFVWGAAGERTTASSIFRIEGRQELEGGTVSSEIEGTEGGWRDVLTEWEAYLYFQPFGQGSTHTLVGRFHFQGGWEMETPFQLTLGGRFGVRGYSENEFPGGQRLLFSLEDRIRLDWPRTSLFDLGLTAFVDMGQIWDGDVPFGVNSGLKTAVGAGLRFGFPKGSSSVIRVDLAAPVTSGFTASDLVLRIHMREVLGLAKLFSTEQMTRSRRSGIATSFRGVQRR